MNQIEVEYDLDLSKLYSKMEAASDQFGEFERKIQGSAQRNPMAGFTKHQDDFNKSLGQQIQGYQRVRTAEQAIFNERKRLEAQLKDLKSRQLEFIAAGRYSELKEQIKQVEERLKAVNRQLATAPEKTGAVATGFGKIGTALKTAFTATGILFVIDKVIELGKKIIDITGTSERYQNQFARVFEGNKLAAEGYINILQKTADTTNFTFDTLADNAAKLASRGIIPTQKELLALGDTANFINKDFSQLNEAILDGSNPERWKELGFVVSTAGNQMTLSYGDFTTTVDKSVEGAYKAIQQFSQLGKVQGATAEAGKTLSGRMSTLGDTFAGLFRTIGQGSTGILNDFIDLLTSLLVRGIELYKVLSPAFDAIGSALAGVGKAIGGVFTAFGNFQSSAEQSATVAQKFGFYINKYIVSPLVAITLVVAGVIEAFNLVVQGAQLAAAKLSGNKGLEATLSAQIKGTMGRLQDLRKEGQKLRDSFGQDLATYTAKANAARLREERRAALAMQAAENFKPTTGSGSAKTKPDEKAIKAQQDEYNLLKKAKEDYQSEIEKLEKEYGKAQLEALDKNSVTYIKRKAELDRQEIEAERKHLEELYRISKATKTRINERTGKREAVIDLNLKLPATVQGYFDSRTATVTTEEAKRIEELRYQNSLKLLQITRQFDALEIEDVKHKWDEIIKAEIAGFVGTADELKKLEAKLRAQKQQDEDRVKLGQAIRQIREQEDLSLAYVDSAEVERDLKLQKRTVDETLSIEREKEKMRLRIRIDSGKKLIQYLIDQGEKENAVLIRNAKNAVNAAEKQLEEINKLKLDYSSGGGFLGSLLGLKDQELEQFKAALDSIGQSIMNATNAQIEQSDARIQAIEAEIQAKEEQVRIEEERDKEGFANNLKLRRAELEELKRQKAEEEAVRRKAVKTQQELDLISSTSSNITAVADMIAAAAKAFKATAGIPIVGIALSIASVAAIYATIASFRAKTKALTQLREGGRIPLTGRSHEQGGHRIEGTDIEVERGEYVVNAKSSEAFTDAIDAINKNDPKKALMHLWRHVGLPDVIVKQIAQPGFGVKPSADFSQMEKKLDSLADELRAIRSNTKPKQQYVGVGDKLIEIDGTRKTITKV